MPPMFDDREAEFLKELVRQKVPFMIVGLSAAALQGAPVVTQDVDLWFREIEHPGVMKALKKVGGAYVPPMADRPPMFAGPAVALFDIVVHLSGLGDFEQEMENTLKIPLGRFKIPVLRIERIIRSKQAADREKDRLVLPVLRDLLSVMRKREKGRDG